MTCMQLRQHRNGRESTEALLSRLIKLTVETGMITATVATVDLMLFCAFQHANFHFVP